METTSLISASTVLGGILIRVVGRQRGENEIAQLPEIAWDAIRDGRGVLHGYRGTPAVAK